MIKKRLLSISAVIASLALVFGLSISPAFAQESEVSANSDDGSVITTSLNDENVVLNNSDESTVVANENSVSATDDGTSFEGSTEMSNETTPPIVFDGHITDYGRSIGYVLPGTSDNE